MPSGKRRAAAMHEISALAAAQPEEIRTRRAASEQAYQGVLNRLGAKGTYENVGGGASAGTSASDDGGPGIFKKVGASSKAASNLDRRFSGEGPIANFNVLDPEATVKNVENSAQFRIMSRLTAESEQLLAREGDLYDEMIRNTQLPILEGAGAIARENAEGIKRAMARGGSARREALQAVEQIRSRERVNSQKVAAIAQSRQAIDVWSRQNAQDVVKFGQDWASNLGGIRETYNQAMDRASELMVSGALPVMFQAKQAAFDARDQAHAKNRAKLTSWIKGIVGAVSMYYSGGTAGSGLLSEALSGTSGQTSGGGGSGYGEVAGSILSGIMGQGGGGAGGEGQTAGSAASAIGYNGGAASAYRSSLLR